MLTSVPALRGAGLDQLADSIEATARELGVGGPAEAAGEPEAGSEPAAGESAPEAPEQDVPTHGTQLRSVTETLLTRARHGLGGAIVVALAGAARIAGSLGRGRRMAQYGLMRRPEVVWSVLAAVSTSLLVGWVITRIP